MTGGYVAFHHLRPGRVEKSVERTHQAHETLLQPAPAATRDLGERIPTLLWRQERWSRP
ncbi:hypothetical protein [Nonomuraea sp. NPDC003804]|uniref:hypothetical protein n=1 Tax=Nonomuraea sp. NPDC003804 TaxID=3154547 RepID=UPI0033B157D0